jgi:hypothetical protein
MQQRTRAAGAYGLCIGMLATFAALGISAASLPAAAEEPLKIGFGMAETGPLAGTGKSGLLAMTIWAEDINAKGGLLGRQVKLVHYDDQSNPANVPALYAKLIDLDKVDLHADHRIHDTDRDAARHGADGLLRLGQQCQVQIRQIFRHLPVRRKARFGDHAAVLRCGDDARSETEDGRCRLSRNGIRPVHQERREGCSLRRRLADRL